MKPLAGVRIADFTNHAAGPFCTHMLAQLGAECIKIESEMRPDIFRRPHPVYGRLEAASFDQVASNKLSARINLKRPEGGDLARRLVALCDVAAESFRPGVMARLGLGYEQLRTVRPDIVMVSVSSSGQRGPESSVAGYAPLFGAWGGLGYLTGYEDGPPVEMRHVMDHSVGMNAAMATVAALVRRGRTGYGEHVDVSARDVASSLAGAALLEAASGGRPRRIGNDHPRAAPHGVYPTNQPDRWLTIAVMSQAHWRGLLDVMRRPDLARDARFGDQTARYAHRRELDAEIVRWTSALDPDGVVQRLQDAGVPAHLSWTVADIVADAHLRARRSIVQVPDPNGGSRAAVAVPARFSKTFEVGIERTTPALGQDEDYVFGDLLGLSAQQRRALEEAQVIY